MSAVEEKLHIALLSYRGHPHVGGQGVYVDYLSRALVDLGHAVEVFAGPPYPELRSDVPLRKIPSLDLYRPDDPFRRPARKELRDAVDVAEYALMCSAAFPEPLTFSLRVARDLQVQAHRFDVAHDNQCLGYGLLALARRLPVIATVHHPIPVDRRAALAAARSKVERAKLRRWYSFTRMQARVARRLPRLITVSDTARDDVVREFLVDPRKVSVVHNGVDHDLFRPLAHIPKHPGRVIAMASADLPLKGLGFLIEALAKVRTEKDAELVLVGRGAESASVRQAINRLGLADAVHVEGSVATLRLVELYGEAEIAVVPSLYEGFSFPVIEAMSCGLPVVATTGGALPEVAGRDGDTALLVPPGDAGALAAAIGTLLDDQDLRHRIGHAGRRRVLERFTWLQAARTTVEAYRTVMGQC